MLIKGLLIATTNIDFAYSELSKGAKIIYLGDAMSAPRDGNFIKATLLVPDYNCLKYFADGSINEYKKHYTRLLSSPAAAESFASIIALLSKGTEVVLYFPKENNELDYAETLLLYIQKTFGITTQSKTTRPMYDPQYDSANARLLLMYKFIDAENYVMITEELLDMDIDILRPVLSEKWDIPASLNNKDFADRLIVAKENYIKYGSPKAPMMTPITQ